MPEDAVRMDWFTVRKGRRRLFLRHGLNRLYVQGVRLWMARTGVDALLSGDGTPTRPGRGLQRPSTAPRKDLVVLRGIDSHLQELHGVRGWTCCVHPWRR